MAAYDGRERACNDDGIASAHITYLMLVIAVMLSTVSNNLRGEDIELKGLIVFNRKTRWVLWTH